MDPRYLKAKDARISSLTKNYYISTSLLKISSIHQFILEIQQILESHDLKGHIHVSLSPSKNHWRSFKLSWICISMQNISLFHLFIVDIQPRVLRPLLPHPYFDHAQPNIFQSIFNYPEFVSTCKKSDYLIILTHFPNYQAKQFSENPIRHKKWSFPLKMSSANATKSAVSCGFGHIYLRNP